MRANLLVEVLGLFLVLILPAHSYRRPQSSREDEIEPAQRSGIIPGDLTESQRQPPVPRTIIAINAISELVFQEGRFEFSPATTHSFLCWKLSIRILCQLNTLLSTQITIFPCNSITIAKTTDAAELLVRGLDVETNFPNDVNECSWWTFHSHWYFTILSSRKFPFYFPSEYM